VRVYSSVVRVMTTNVPDRWAVKYPPEHMLLDRPSVMDRPCNATPQFPMGLPSSRSEDWAQSWPLFAAGRTKYRAGPVRSAEVTNRTRCCDLEQRKRDAEMRVVYRVETTAHCTGVVSSEISRGKFPEILNFRKIHNPTLHSVWLLPRCMECRQRSR